MKPKFNARLRLALSTLTLALAAPSAFSATETFNTAGTFNWVCPGGVTSVQVECWGGGGAGGAGKKDSAGNIGSNGGGGGGGAYARRTVVNVTPGLTYPITIPAAAVSTAVVTAGVISGPVNGGSVTFVGDSGVTTTAAGGAGGVNKYIASGNPAATGSAGGTGGAVASSVGDVRFAGGAGSAGNGTASNVPGSGGGGAGNANNGGAASTVTGTPSTTTPGLGGVAGGGAGGQGNGIGNVTTESLAGSPGSTPGGGGGGAHLVGTGTKLGGTGGLGQVVLTYTDPPANYKGNNPDALNLASSWTAAYVPNAGNTPAEWNNLVAGPNTTDLGANIAFSGIKISDPAGPVTINAGTPTTNTLTLGAAAIDLDLSAATQDLTINSDLAMSAANVWDVAASRTLTLGGAVSGSVAVTKQGLGTATLSGLSATPASNYSGTTTIDQGTLALTTTSPSLTGGLTFGASAGSTNTGALDLTGIAASATFGNLTVRTDGAFTNTITVGSGKTLTFAGAALDVGFNNTTATTTKLTIAGASSGVGSLVFDNASAAIRVGVAPGSDLPITSNTLDLSTLGSVSMGTITNPIISLKVGGRTTSGTLILSDTANVITATTLDLGHSNGGNPGSTNLMTLGAGTNVLNVDTINIGFSKATATLKFDSQTAGSPGTVTVLNKAGATGLAALNIGSQNGTSTGTNLTGTLDLRGHTATVNVGAVDMGRTNQTSTGAANGILWFDTGTYDATSLNLGVKSSSGTGSNNTNAVNIGGGTFAVSGAVSMADHTGTGATGNVTSKFNLTNGTVNLGSTVSVANKNSTGGGIATGEINVSGGALNITGLLTLAKQASAGSATGRLNLTGGVVTSYSDIIDGGGTTNTALKVDGGALDMKGNSIGTSGAPIDTLTFAAGTLQNLAELNGGGALTKTGAGTLTLTGTNTYTGGTNVNAGTLLVSGALGMPATGTLQVNAGGNFSLADGIASATTTTAALGLSSGATLTFDWNGGSLDTITSTVAATTVGAVGISINSTSPTGSGGTLISSPLGGLTTANGTQYFLVNNINYAANLSVTDTAVSIGTITTGLTPLTNAYWKGGQLTGSGLGAMALSTGAASNWASNAAGTSSGGLVPSGSAVNVIFSASGATEQTIVTTGASMNLGSITFNDSTAVTLGGSDFITLNSTSATAATSSGSGTTVTPGSAISVTSSANVANTINANLTLAVNQTWNVASGKTLSVGGAVAGSGALALADAGTLVLSGSNNYTGNTSVSAGTLEISGTGAIYNATTNTATVTVAPGAQIILSGGAKNNALGFGASANWAVSGTINSTGGSAQTLPGNLTLNNGTLTGIASIAPGDQYGTFFSGAGGSIITANGATNTLSAGNVGMASGGTLTLATPLVGDALAVSSALGVNVGTPQLAGALAKTGLGTVTLSGANIYTGATTVSAGTLTVAPAGSITTSGSIVLSVSGADAVANIDGTYTSTGGGGVAVNSGGVLNTSGTVAISGANNSAILLGTAAGPGTWNVTGGTVSVNYASNGWGLGAGGVGTLNVSAGSVTTAATNVFNVGHGAGGTGIFTVSGTGLVTVSAGSGAFRLGANATSTGTVNLDGGTLALGRNVTTVAGSTSTFNFNGGVLQAGLSSTTYMTGLTTANVRNGGAKIDTNGFNVTIGQALLHSAILGDNATDGGLTKIGSGTLTLSGANTYTGATLVSAGTLKSSTAGSAATDITVAGSAASGVLVAATDGQWISTGDLTLNNNSNVVIDYGSTTPSTATAPIKVDNLVAGTNLGLKFAAATFSGLNGLTVGQTYPLMTWTTSGPADPSAFTILTPRLVGTLSVASNTLSMTVTSNAAGIPISWNTGDGAWNTLATNWVDANLVTTAYVDPDDGVFFGDALGATGNPTITLNSAFSPAGGVTMNSISHDYTITGSGGIGGAGVLTLSASNTRTLTLATTNTYTGGTVISGGTLKLSGSGSLGAGSVVVNSGGLLDLNGTSRSITFAAGTGVGTVANNSGSGTSTLTLTGTAPITGSYATLVDNTNATAGKVALVITANSQSWSNANTYSGGTTVNSGAYLYLNGSTPLGAGTGTINLTTAGTGVGTGSGLVVDGATYANDLTGAGYVHNNANSGATVVTTTLTGNINTSGPFIFRAGTGIVYNFAGNGTTSSLSGVIGSTTSMVNGAVATGSVIKSGSGTLTLSGTNVYSGSTTLSAGILRATTNASALGAGTLSLGGGTLQLANDTGLSFGRNTTVTANSTIASDTLTAVPGVTHTLGTLSIGAFQLNVGTGSNATGTTAGITFGNTTLTGNAAVNVAADTTLNLNGTVGGAYSLTVSGTGTVVFGSASAGALSNLGGLVISSGSKASIPNNNMITGTIPLTVNGTLTNGAGEIFGVLNGSGTINQVSNALYTNSSIDGVFSGSITGAGTYVKQGTSTQTLSGINTYTGGTTVSAGTLVLADNAQLKFVIGATPGTNNSIIGAGTITIDGDFNIDTTLTDASALTAGTWTLVNAATLTETFGSTFTILGAGWSETANVWTKTVGSKKYTFTEADGILTLSPATSYATWIDGFFPGETNPLIIGAGADPDNDGIANGVEMVIGGNPKLGMDTALLPTIELVTDPVSVPTIPTGNYLLFTYRRSDLSVTAGVTAGCETDTDLVGPWTPAIDGVSNVLIQVDNNFTFTPPATADTDRVRVYVPRGANTKLFGRLNVVVP